MSGDFKTESLDRLDGAWWADQVARWLIFAGGLSAIVFILAIFIFVGKEGLGFAFQDLSWSEFFTSIRWRPTSETNPTYGSLALIAGTASVTGLAMLIAVPFSLGAAIFIAEFARGKLREFLVQDPAQAVRFVRFLEVERLITLNQDNLRLMEARAHLALGDTGQADMCLTDVLDVKPKHLNAEALRREIREAA